MLFFVLDGISQAVTVSSSPNPSTPGQSVTATVTATFPPGFVSCTLQINWGESPSWENLSPGCTSTPCTRTANHIYNTPGIKTISVRPGFSCVTPPNAPTNPSTTQTVNCKVLNIKNWPSTLPSGTAGLSYFTYALDTRDGQTPYTYSISSGSLPPGLSLNTSTGAITGTPTTPGSYSFTIRVTDICFSGAQTASKAYIISIECAPLSITTVSLPAGTAGQAYSQQIQSTGGYGTKTYSVIAGSLPTGLSLNSSTGAITGTPTAAGTYPFTIRVADSCTYEAQYAQQAYSLFINPAGCTPLSITSPSVLSTGTVGSAYTYQVTTSGGQAPITFSLLSGSLPPGMNLGSTGLITGIPTSSGNYTFTVRATDSCAVGAQASDKSLSIMVNPAGCTPLSITSPSVLSTGTVGSAYTYQVTTSGGQPPITYSLVSGLLPPGLNLSPTGLISGTTTTGGNYSFTIAARDNCSIGAQITQKTFSLTVNQAPPATVFVIPTSFTIPRGQSSSKNVSYQFTASSLISTTLTSSGGSFIAGGETVEVNTLPLTVSILNGSGRVSEMLTIPVAVTERAIQRGAARFSYVRIFTGPDVNLNATVNFTITTEAGADFNIKRIELYFENRRSEITVNRNYPKLKAYADIRFIGSGLLHGYWEVDGRVLSHVDQHLTFGTTVTLQIPEIPPLPTFDTGTHIVRFIITNPETDIPLPSILYFVTSEEAKAILIGLSIVSPENNALLEYEPVRFEWEKLNRITLFLIQYFDDLESHPVFSAYTRKLFYSLPEIVFKSIFSPGKKYHWKVKGFDAENNIVGESEVRSFTFKKLNAYVPGQIITAFSESTFSESLLDEFKDKHDLKVIDTCE